MRFTDHYRSDWNSIGGLMAALLLVQAGLAAAMAGNMLPMSGPALFPFAAATAIGSIVITFRCRMPRWAKAGAGSLLAFALLVVSATHDVFGMRAVDHEVASALKGSDATPPLVPTTVSAEAVQVEFRPPEAVDDNGFADALARDFATTPRREPGRPLEITGSTDFKRTNDRDIYMLSWSVRRDGDALWCGRTSVITGQITVAVTASRRAIDEAVSASRNHDLSCRATPSSSG